MKKFALGAIIFGASVSASFANEYGPAMQSYLDASISGWVADPVIVSAINDQNSTTGAYDQTAIDRMDQDWRSQVGTGDEPLVDRVLFNDAAEFLRQQVEISGGAITEAFIMDARGLNVAASTPTSDMWQGDEAKFQETYPNGPDAAHFGEIEFDESSQTYQGQISLSITDPATGEVIGAITIGVDAEALL